ncbi:MAG: S1 RNA-binding domain-containing protein [Gemmatimonadetes bacterium]|nr:S1 RNA-binding domain-containing protein [Gemmatimonadota bacterium]
MPDNSETPTDEAPQATDAPQTPPPVVAEAPTTDSPEKVEEPVAAAEPVAEPAGSADEAVADAGEATSGAPEVAGPQESVEAAASAPEAPAAPATAAPETVAPETVAPETVAPETAATEMTTPPESVEVVAPAPAAPAAPATAAPETVAPETAAAEMTTPPESVEVVAPAPAAPVAPDAIQSADAAPEVVDMGKLLEGETGTAVPDANVGDRVSGVLVRVGEENSFIDFGGRSEGVLGTNELKGEDGELVFAVGEPLEAFVVSATDEVRLSRFLKGEDREADKLYKAFKTGTPIEGLVMAVNKWGLGVELAGTRAFCPISQIDTAFVQNPEEYRDKTMKFKIIRFRDRGRSIVLSRRALLEAEQEKHATTVRAQIAVDAIVPGTVTRLESFGAFVDLGHGVEGLVHVSELKHERVGHPQEVVESGQEIKVKILEIKSLGSRRKERISLSIKALEADPWGEVRTKFPQGSVVSGKVEAIESYGAFVELAENVRGLVHVSEMADRRVNHPRDVVAIGEEVKVAVVELDNKRKRMRLSIRRAEQMEGEANLKEFADRQKREQEEEGGANSTMLDALKRAQLID